MFFDTENGSGSGATAEIIKDWFSLSTARSEQQFTVPNLSQYKFIIFQLSCYADNSIERTSEIDFFSNNAKGKPLSFASPIGAIIFVSYDKLKQHANTEISGGASWGSNGAATIAKDYIKYVNDTTIKVYVDQIGLRQTRIIGIK